ncbi:WD40-repeat-containing domain protein [Hygrophoropsis aurantiaca]|uniref:WD40-repeat-containing domain protein n=1 Tax=Hygrophoropsis aurantiaca TaxID=72124 RepID=A0ACB7ZZ32_9AGAM|nr:WD40-repeat-containing domain protein [Hygrophoropsis aurantiaca]
MSTSASPEVENGPAMQARTSTKVFKGHTNWVVSVAYFSDGERIISGSFDKTVRIWNVETQKQEGDSMMHDFLVTHMALSPDGRTLVSSGTGVVFWDLESRTMIWKKEREEAGEFRVAYSPTGKLIAASREEEIELLDAETGKQIREPLQFGGVVWSLAFSPDGLRLAAGARPSGSPGRTDSGSVRVFDVVTGVTSLEFTLDGVTTSSGKFAIGLFNTAMTSLVFSLDGQQIITTAEGSVRVWDAATGHEVGNPMLTGYLIHQIALNPDGRRIAITTHGQNVFVWDLTTRRQIGRSLQARRKYGLLSVAWSPDGRSIIAGEVALVGSGVSQIHLWDSKIHLWDVPPLDTVTLPVLSEGSPPLPSTGTSQPRRASLSPSILDLPATSLKLPVNTSGGGDNWESATNDSFDSVLDLDADGTQPAQRRKRRRRHGTPAASTSPPSIPVVPTNMLATAERGPHAPQGRTIPPAPLDAQTSRPRFGSLLTQSWIRRLMVSIRRTPKLSFTNVADDPLQARENPKTTHSAQQSQGDAEQNPSESRQVNNTRPRERRQRSARRNGDGIGMIAPSPMYDRYQVATEEYWYDPNNPPLIDRIFFCMICCGVPKDDASYISNVDSDPEPSVPPADTQAGPSTSQSQRAPLAAADPTTTPSTPARPGGVSRLWRRILNLVLRRILNLVLRPSHRKQQESHQLQTAAHTAPQPSCRSTP